MNRVPRVTPEQRQRVRERADIFWGGMNRFTFGRPTLQKVLIILTGTIGVWRMIGYAPDGINPMVNTLFWGVHPFPALPLTNTYFIGVLVLFVGLGLAPFMYGYVRLGETPGGLQAGERVRPTALWTTWAGLVTMILILWFAQWYH